MQKIIEKILEPSQIETGSNFKLKIRAIRYANYSEVKGRLNYTNIQNYEYKNLKGE